MCRGSFSSWMSYKIRATIFPMLNQHHILLVTPFPDSHKTPVNEFAVEAESYPASPFAAVFMSDGDEYRNVKVFQQTIIPIVPL